MPRYIKSHSILWTFRAINILMRGKNQWFDMSIDFHKFQVVGRDQNGRYQASSYGESRVLTSRWSIIKSIIWIIGRSVFQRKEQKRQYYHRECFQKIKSFLWYFDRRNEACSYGWQRRMSLNDEQKFWRFWKFWTTRTLMQRTKSTVIHFKTPLQ